MPDYRGAQDTTVIFQVNCAYATGITGNGMDIKLTYDKTLLTPIEIQKTVLTEDFTFVDNISIADGQINISGVSATGAVITGEGHLLDILFQVAPAATLDATGSHTFIQVKMYDAALHALAVDYTDTAIFTVALNYMLGDVTGDGIIDSADSLMALQASIGERTLTPIEFAAADVIGDGRIDSADVTLILRLAVGLPINPPDGSKPSAKWLATHTMAGAYHLSIPQIFAAQGTHVSVPVSLDNTEGIAGLDLVVNFGPSVLLLENVSKGELTQSAFTLDYDTTASSVHISLASGQPLPSGSGVILWLNFKVVGQPGDVTTLLPAYLKLGGEFGENIAWKNAVGKSSGTLTVSETTGLSDEVWQLYR
jgi:hypothetical protein